MQNQFAYPCDKFHERPLNNNSFLVPTHPDAIFNQSLIFENSHYALPTLDVNLGEGDSLKLERNLLQQSFYNQWELDDPDDRKLLDNLKNMEFFKAAGTLNQEYFEYNKDDQKNVMAFKDQGIQRDKENIDNNYQHLKILNNQQHIQSNFDRRKDKLPIKKLGNAGLIDTLLSEYTLYHSPDKLTSACDDLPSVEKKNITPPCEKIDELKEENFISKNKEQSVKITEPKVEIMSQLASSKKEAQHNLEKKANENIPAVEEALRYSDLSVLRKQKEEELSRPISFNIMVVGQSGLGKSTFIETFIAKKFKTKEGIRMPTNDIIEIKKIKTDGKTTFSMNFVDTPGYSNEKDVREWYKKIKNYLIDKFDEYREEEKRLSALGRNHISARKLEDKRVHSCLYFISGPTINKIDLKYMKKLQKYTNVIPIIAKGDLYTVETIKNMKATLIKASHNYKIEWFDFSNQFYLTPFEFPQVLKENSIKLKIPNESRFGSCPPFMIISSINKLEISPNKFVYGREYPWGICDIENPNHSDFLILYNLLGSHICFDCIRYTHSNYNHYYKSLRKKKEEKKIEDTFKRSFSLGIMIGVGFIGTMIAMKKKI